MTGARGRPRCPTRGERGAASILVLAMLGVVLLVGSALGVVAVLVVDHRTAQAAADLAVLASARALADGVDPCAAGSSIATANGATLVDCETSGSTVTVRVVVPGPHWLGQRHDLTGVARAGPADSRHDPP